MRSSRSPILRNLFREFLGYYINPWPPGWETAPHFSFLRDVYLKRATSTTNELFCSGCNQGEARFLIESHLPSVSGLLFPSASRLWLEHENDNVLLPERNDIIDDSTAVLRPPLPCCCGCVLSIPDLQQGGMSKEQRQHRVKSGLERWPPRHCLPTDSKGAHTIKTTQISQP